MLYVQHVDWVLLHLVQITFLFEGILSSCVSGSVYSLVVVSSGPVASNRRLFLRFEPGAQRGSRQRSLMMRGRDVQPTAPPPALQGDRTEALGYQPSCLWSVCTDVDAIYRSTWRLQSQSCSFFFFLGL